jgi:hypothetical protein
MSIKKLVTFVIVSMLLVYGVSDAKVFEGNYQINISGVGLSTDEKEAGLCKDFRLTDKQVRYFFDKAQVVSRRVIHDHHDWFPCYVSGTVDIKGKRLDWRIRPDGVGELVLPDGSIELLSCREKKCRY